MATNIEQIFRSFVVSKFREIQEQHFGSGKVAQQNGEINSSEQVNSANDTVVSIGTLQNDPLVQKIEQVLSEVLGAESQYKTDVELETVKNKSRSTKRGIPDEVQDETPRKKSKKDKKHKDKKKKKRKKEKKEKKYKKQSKESKLSSDHKGCGDIQPDSHLNPESLVLSAENVDIGPASLFMEKTVYENLNSSLANSHDTSNPDTSKLDVCEEDSVLINIQEICEVQLTNERELETCQHTNLPVHLQVEDEDESLNTADVESDDICMARVAETDIKEMEKPESYSALQTAENINVSENSLKHACAGLESLETRVEPFSVEVKELDFVSESLNPEIITQPESTSFEKTGCKFMKSPLETVGEAKDSVTTLGFLAMVVGKDFEATSEFLNKAKVKASETSLKDDALTDMKDELQQNTERNVMMKDLGGKVLTQSRIEMKDLESFPESVCTVTEKDPKFSLALKPKIWPEDSERITESDECKCIGVIVDAETMGEVRELKEAETSTIVMELKDPQKSQKSLEIVADTKDFKGMPELEVRTDSGAYLLATEVETKNLETATEFEEVDERCSGATPVCQSEKEKWDVIPDTLETVCLKNLDSFSELAGSIPINYLEASLETAVNERGDMAVVEVTKDSDTVVEVKVSESIPRSETVPEINDSETAAETLDIAKTQYLDVSKHVAVTDTESETVVNLKDLKKVPEECSMTLKKLETISETFHMTEMKHVKDVLQSDVVAQREDSEINLKPGDGEERDLDAASESLHMIFTNYSEHSLELYTEPEAMMELKNSERTPELLHMEDANNSEALITGEVKHLKIVESTAVTKLNDLEKKIESLDRDVKNRDEESKAVTDVKYLETLVPSGAVPKETNLETVSHSVTEIKEKAADTTGDMGRSQNTDETVSLEMGSQKVKSITGKELPAEIKGPFFISESFQEVNIVSSETTPELDSIAVIQQLKEMETITPVLDVDSPNKTLGLQTSDLIDPRDSSKLLNAVEEYESISGHHAVQNLESLQHVKTKVREINLGSQHSLEVRYSAPSPELLFPEELSNLQEKQKLEESTEATSFTAVPDSPYALETDLIDASESGDINEVMVSEHSSESMAQTNSDNFRKSLYVIQLKDSKTVSESKIMDAKDLEIDSESSHRGGAETEDLPEYESVAASQALEIIEECPKKNEMQESNTAFGNKTLTVPGLEVDSETVCVMDIENLEVKKQVVPTSLFTYEMIGIEATPIPVCAAEHKEFKTSEIIEAAVEVKHLVASTSSVEVVKETFDPTCVTDRKDSEANQIWEANLESVDKKEVDTEFDHEAAPNGSEIFKKHKTIVVTGATEGILPAINTAEGKEPGTDLKPQAALVKTYTESVSESVKISETEDYDATVSLFMVDIKDSETSSVFVDAGEVKTLEATVPVETTPEPICVLELGNSDDVESVLTTEMKGLGETLNCEVILEAQDSIPIVTNLNTSELKSSESVCIPEVRDSERTVELRTTPTYLSSTDLKSSDMTAEMKALDMIDSETPLKSETEVKYFESVSETDQVLEPFHHKAVPESECISEEKSSETTSEVVCMKLKGLLETTPESKRAHEIKDLEPFAESVCRGQATGMEENLIYEEVLDVSETTPQFSSIVEIEDFKATASSMVPEMGKESEKKLPLYYDEKCSETTTKITRVPDLMVTYADVEPVSRVEGKYSEPTAEVACVVNTENSEANSGFIGITKLKDTAKSETDPELVQLKDLENIPKCESVGKVKELQVFQSSIDKEGTYFKENSKSPLVLESQHLERESASVLVPEIVSEVSLKSIYAMKAKDSEAALEYMKVKGVEVSKQNSEFICVGEKKDLEPAPDHTALAQAKNSEMFSEVTLEVKNLEATSESLSLMKEKDAEVTILMSSEEQLLKASLKPVCIAEENNLAASQQVTVEVKDLEAALEPAVMTGKDLEAPSCESLKDKHLEAVPKSSEIMNEEAGSISKDRKSEKISSKSKDKSKSGKKAKKSRSKSPSKPKKRKKKSRSRSTSRQMSSRRARSRSKNDADSRKKHSTSRRKSRSKSVERKEGKESSLRSRRRRSRTSDHHKSRSKSVDKRETSLRSRRRQSRSSDRRKSRSKSVDRRESTRTRRRLSRSSDNHKSRSKSVDKRETLVRSRWRRSRSSDHHKSRSRSIDKREASTRTRRRRSRSSDNHKSRSRSIDKRETSVRRRRRRSRSSDNYKSRSKSVDKRESPVRSRRRRSRSSDHHKSRSRSVDDRREISVRTRRKRSRSSENHRSRSKSTDKRECLRTGRRRSRSSDNRKSRSRSGDKEILRTRRRRSRSSDHRKSRSKSVDKRESSVRARRRRSRSSDNRRSRSKSVDKRETSLRTKRRRSRSSDNRKSRSKSVDTRETSTRTKSRRSRSSDNRKSRSKSVDKRETSAREKSRRSRSKSVDKRDTSVRAKRRRSRSSDNRKSRSKSSDKRETVARAKRRRSQSSDIRKSRSKSVDKTEVSARSKRRRSKSADHKSITKSGEKRESSLKSRHRRSKSSDRQKSKSKSRSKSSERRKDKDSLAGSKEKSSKSRSKSKSPEKTEGTESLEASVCNRAKSPEHPKSKSRSRSKSLDKTENRERLRRSRSKCSEPRSHTHRTVSRSRRNRSRSLTRKRSSRSKSDPRSRSRSRSCSRRWRRTRSRSVSRLRSLSRERRRRSRRNRSRSVDRRRRRSDSRDSYRITLRLRSRSRTPVRLGTSRSTGRRRSSSVSPDHRRSRSSSRSPKRLTDLDKAQLLEIAKANAAAMCAKAGVPLPPSLMPVVTPEKKEEKVTQKSAKETIMELTEKCKKIAQSQEDDVIVNKPHVSDEEEEEHPFINHPFKLNEPKPIFFNLTTPTIKPAPPKNQVTLTKEFPVSSGSQHRKKEADSAYGEWVPVEKNKEENKDDVFPNPATLEPVDISSALNERTIAQKRLTENTFDLEAMCLLNRAQERIDAWAQLNSLPGQFTGSTGAQVLSSEQLSNSGPQAWIKKYCVPLQDLDFIRRALTALTIHDCCNEQESCC
ncbi:protein SON isoform X2 [Eublepharis macularius]|uniref:Protein SON isoform X2 n=1 Tax=Eublepharis macularius TaxID=481883 RepID=A0AA97J1I8_EUBMA|nr:protein SON isoform X2 [Eublepharis macularius]XP_054829380.1 protein SON isoform X2 [Eublepharis macularius]XP_054829381.1 protein SON isoform X2 [Eublepharis macularius]